MVEYKVDVDDIELTLFELLDVGQLRKLPRFSGQTVDEYRAIVREAVALARRDLAPLNERGDRVGAHVVEGRGRVPEGFRGAWRKLCELGLAAMDLVQDHGGLGLPAALAAVAGELVIGACPSVGSFHILTHEVARMLSIFGTEAQRKEHLSRLPSGGGAG